MHVIILVAFLLSHVPLADASPRLNTTSLCILLGSYWGVLLAMGAIDLLWTRRAIRRSGFPAGDTNRIFRRHGRMIQWMQFWLLGGLAGLCLLGWREWIELELHLGQLPLLPTLATMFPFFIGLLMVWIMGYPFHLALRKQMAYHRRLDGLGSLPYWTMRQYLLFNLRHNLLFILVPICLILLGVESFELYLVPHLRPEWQEAGGVIASFSIALVVFLLAPLLVVRIWKTTPLPAGELRDSLESLCQRLQIRYRNILIWQSGGVLANAGAMGLIGPVRYILLSDALLNDCPPGQIRAIFAHEAAHIRHHHIFYSGLFAVAAALLSSVLAWLLYAGLQWADCPVEQWSQELGQDDMLEILLVIISLAAIWAVGFGYVSKRFERQADVVGAWASGPTGPPENPRDPAISPAGAVEFAHSLQSVCEMNGIPMQQRNWRHGRMVDRIDYIYSLGENGSRVAADRSVKRIKWVLWLVIGLMGLWMAASYLLPAGLTKQENSPQSTEQRK